MRPDLFDESKIIKKNDANQNNISQNIIEDNINQSNIENNDVTNDNVIQNKIIENNDIVKDNTNKNIIKNKITGTTSIKSFIKINKVVTEQNKNVSISKQPVFVFSKDKDTKEIITQGKIQNKSINVNIPRDQLTIIYNNTVKYYNELLLEIEILKQFKNDNNDMKQYCNNKLSIYKEELKYVEYKISILNNLNRKE